MDPGGGLSSSAICAFISVRGLWYTFFLVLVERVFSCFDLDGHCRFWVVYGMCCRRLGVYSGASGTVVDIKMNIRGLRGKIVELLCHLHQDLPYLICLSEHHSGQSEIDLINIEHYSLGAKYCRKKLKRGGVTIYCTKP
jgi:hypothetical protein